MGIAAFILFLGTLERNNCLSCKGATSMEAAKNKRLYAIYTNGQDNKKRNMRKKRSPFLRLSKETKKLNFLSLIANSEY